MQEEGDTLDIGSEHARKLLRQHLENRQVADLEALIRHLDMPREIVERELLGLTAHGEIERAWIEKIRRRRPGGVSATGRRPIWVDAARRRPRHEGRG